VLLGQNLRLVLWVADRAAQSSAQNGANILVPVLIWVHRLLRHPQISGAASLVDLQKGSRARDTLRLADDDGDRFQKGKLKSVDRSLLPAGRGFGGGRAPNKCSMDFGDLRLECLVQGCCRW
jgi:hypothetical protein